MASVKKKLRKFSLEHRDTLENREQRSVVINALLLRSQEFRLANRTLFYVSSRSEVNTHNLIDQALQESREVYVPYCTREQLRCFRIFDRAELYLGNFGVLEPVSEVVDDPSREVFPADLDLVIVPGAAFDLRGYRLGYGKGYYDRLLAQIRDDAVSVGLAFSSQVVNRLPNEDHDVAVHFLITENDLIKFPNPPRQ